MNRVKNGVRRRAIELLVRDGLDERLKRRAARFRLQLAWAVFADEPPHYGINGGEMFVTRRRHAKSRQRFDQFLDFGDALAGFLRLEIQRRQQPDDLRAGGNRSTRPPRAAG